MSTVFLSVLYVVESLEAEILKQNFMQQWSDSRESVTVVFFMYVVIRSYKSPVNDMIVQFINDLDKVLRT